MVHNIENDNPKTFTNIKVFAGDKSKPAADASYKNLVWENLHANQSLNIGTKIQKNKQIGQFGSILPGQFRSVGPPNPQISTKCVGSLY